MIGSVDANLMAHLALGLPPSFTCFFRKSDGTRQAVVVVIASCVIACATSMLVHMALVSSGVAAELQLLCLLNPFAVCIGLLTTYVATRTLILHTAIGKHWAFALQNDIAFCADETTLDYWRLSRLQSPSRESNGSEPQPRFSVVRFRTRWSGCMCKLVIFRLQHRDYRHMSTSAQLAAWIADAVHLARAHAASRRAIAVLVLVLPTDVDSASVQRIQDTLAGTGMWCECAHSSRLVVAVAASAYPRWERATHDWCRNISFSQEALVVRLELGVAHTT